MTLFISGTIADKPQSWPLDQPAFTIGRSSRNSIHIPDGTVSKDHAEIVRRGDRNFIRDLGSRNGTRVNGVEAREAIALTAGDRLEIGHIQLRVTEGPPQLEVTLSDATVIGSSKKIRVEQVLERRSRTAEGSAHIIHLLAEAGKLLVLPRPLKETCDELLQFVEKAVPASRYVVLMRPAPDAEPVQVAARLRGGRASQPLALSRAIMKTVMDECTSVMTSDAALDPRFQGRESIVAQSVHSAMAVPLFDNENVLGVLYVDTQDFSLSLGDEQLELLTLLANMAAIKITNARLLEADQARARLAQELATATEIQRGLLPAAPPRVPGWEFDALIQTCHEVGGDLYDFHRRADGTVIFVVGDVTGKGMGAALLMSSFLASARVLYDVCGDVADLATRLGGILFRTTDSIRFVTGVVCALDPATGTLSYVNAGHPAMALVLGDEVLQLESTGIPFGVLPSFAYTARTVELSPGALLAVVSDGIPEAQRGDAFFDDQRLYDALREASARPLPGVRDHVMARVNEFLEDEPRSDDITLLLVRREPAATSGS
jgi:sigma-B regulation protein RsbU (phosphoserine phosphatase)